VVYKYDAIGSHERMHATCIGRGEKFIQPMLDDLEIIGDDKSKWSLSSSHDLFESSDGCFVNLTIAEAKRFVKSAFRSAAEREITIGNGISYKILRKVHGNNKVESYHELL